MMSKALPLALSAALLLFPLGSQADEVVLGAYVYHRHGDRTAKAWKPVGLTALGATQAYGSGTFYRRRYVDGDGTLLRIAGGNGGSLKPSSLAVTAPADAVLHDSALAFAQGLYPPGGESSAETLANGTRVEAPLGGYRYIRIDTVEEAATADGAESSAWLQGSSGCRDAEVSSNGYLSSRAYTDEAEASLDFYRRLEPVIEGTYAKDQANFKNAYSIFDLVNVATIHNKTISSNDLLTESTLDRLHDLASVHEWNLAFNESEPIRAIAGAVLAGQVLNALEAVVKGSAGAKALNVEFGAYGTFMSFFGLAGLPAASADFYGICDYASSMAFELVTNSTTHPKPEDVSVRFFFSNGTASDNSFESFPLFGQDKVVLSWAEFKEGMERFAVKDDKQWCKVCGNNDGQCASSGPGASDDGSVSGQSQGGSGGGISKVVAGVIGAMVTLAVVLGLEALFVLLFGLRLVRKSTLLKTMEQNMTEQKL